MWQSRQAGNDDRPDRERGMSSHLKRVQQQEEMRNVSGGRSAEAHERLLALGPSLVLWALSLHSVQFKDTG